MAEADLQSAREFYDFLVRNNQLKPDVFEQHRQLQERFGDTAAAASMTTTDAPMTDAAAEPMPELDNFMRLFEQPVATGGDPLPDDADPMEAGLLDMRAERRGQPTTMEKRIMSPTGIASDFPTPKEMQAAAPNRLDNRSDFRKFVDDLSTPDKEEPKTDTLVAAEDTKEQVLQRGETAATTQQEMTTVGADEGEAKATDASLTREEFQKEAETLEATLPTDLQKTVFSTAIAELEAMRAPFTDEEGEYKFMSRRQELLDLRDTLNQDISAYETKIQEIAEEKQKPVLEGMNKVLAILGAAIGAAGAALTRTPNEAMQMLMAFVDNEQDKFLQSKQMRVKSADQQRVDLIRRRGEVLQELINQTKQMAGIAEFNIERTKAVANLRSIEEQLKEQSKKNDQNFAIARANQIVAGLTLMSKMTSKEREFVAPNMGANPGETGVTFMRGKIVGEVMKQVFDFNQVYGEVQQASKTIFEVLEKEKLGAISAQALSDARSKIEQRLNQIKVNAAKKLYQFGAALTANEQELLESIIASAKRTDIALGITQTRLNEFLVIMEEKRQALRTAGGFVPIGQVGTGSQMPQQNQTPQEVPGLQARN